jgi:hypothetical protein
VWPEAGGEAPVKRLGQCVNKSITMDALASRTEPTVGFDRLAAMPRRGLPSGVPELPNVRRQRASAVIGLPGSTTL